MFGRVFQVTKKHFVEESYAQLHITVICAFTLTKNIAEIKLCLSIVINAFYLQRLHCFVCKKEHLPKKKEFAKSSRIFLGT